MCAKAVGDEISVVPQVRVSKQPVASHSDPIQYVLFVSSQELY
jgi:hypothetical protein